MSIFLTSRFSIFSLLSIDILTSSFICPRRYQLCQTSVFDKPEVDKPGFDLVSGYPAQELHLSKQTGLKGKSKEMYLMACHMDAEAQLGRDRLWKGCWVSEGSRGWTTTDRKVKVCPYGLYYFVEYQDDLGTAGRFTLQGNNTNSSSPMISVVLYFVLRYIFPMIDLIIACVILEMLAQHQTSLLGLYRALDNDVSEDRCNWLSLYYRLVCHFDASMRHSFLP